MSQGSLCTLMVPGHISLAYLIDFRMIKLYLLPMLAKYGRDSISLQSPVTYQFEMVKHVRQVLSL